MGKLTITSMSDKLLGINNETSRLNISPASNALKFLEAVIFPVTGNTVRFLVKLSFIG